jgi:hypothetical protein
MAATSQAAKRKLLPQEAFIEALKSRRSGQESKDAPVRQGRNPAGSLHQRKTG